MFVIVLENQGYAATFGDPSADPYLASTLPDEGALLNDYYATGHESNDNYISLVSGQPPNPQNQADCQIFDDFTGADLLSDGVETGTGCVYPAGVQNIGTQLSAAGLNWKAYEEDMGNDPNRETAACGHPALDSQDRNPERRSRRRLRHPPRPVRLLPLGDRQPDLLRRARRRARARRPARCRPPRSPARPASPPT